MLSPDSESIILIGWAIRSLGKAGPLRVRSGQAFVSAEVRFPQDDRSFVDRDTGDGTSLASRVGELVG